VISVESTAETAAETCARLRASLERALRPLVPGEARVVLVGTGLANPGDCAIAAATRRWLERTASGRWLELDRRTYDRAAAARFLAGGGVVLHAGGGTLGDVWGSQEALRRRALDDFPGVPAVQLPQTIHFATEAGRREARAFYGGRRNLTMLVRDEAGVRTSREEWGLETVLAPDMAFLLDLEPSGLATRDVLWLLRADQESRRVTAQRTLGPSPVPESVDWPPPRARLRRGLRRAVVRTLAPGADAPLRRRLVASLDAATALRRTHDGVRLLSSARVVATDRLHGTLLSLLLGIPVVAVGDRNGKVRAFHDAWLRPSSAVRWCDSVEEARVAAAERAAARN
jgi:exopolysaccharide biosynthesis predicted pyruvyltransferase EpsI